MRDHGSAQNALEVTVAHDEAVVRDRNATLRPGVGCRADRRAIRCPVPRGSNRRLIVLVDAGRGDDRVRVDRPADEGASAEVEVHGGAGDDAISVASTTARARNGPLFATVGGGPGRDVLAGGDGTDDLHGGPGRDVLRGRAGNDMLGGDTNPRPIDSNGPDPARPGRLERDVIAGGRGRDALDYGGHSQPVSVDLPAQSATDDGITSIEGASGGLGDDLLIGDGGPNSFDTGGGRDRVEGAGGDDGIHDHAGRATIRAGAGDDSLSGPTRDDTCGPGRDVITPGRDDGRLDVRRLTGDCEDTVLGSYSELRIPLAGMRLTGRGFRFAVEHRYVGLRPSEVLGVVDFVPREAQITVTAAGTRLVSASSTVPEATFGGNRAHLSVPLTPAGRRRLAASRPAAFTLSLLTDTDDVLHLTLPLR